MMLTDLGSLIQQAADRRSHLTVTMVDGSVHEGFIQAVDVDGGFVRLSSDGRLLINLRQSLTVRIGPGL